MRWRLALQCLAGYSIGLATAYFALLVALDPASRRVLYGMIGVVLIVAFTCGVATQYRGVFRDGQAEQEEA